MPVYQLANSFPATKVFRARHRSRKFSEEASSVGYLSGERTPSLQTNKLLHLLDPSMNHRFLGSGVLCRTIRCPFHLFRDFFVARSGRDGDQLIPIAYSWKYLNTCHRKLLCPRSTCYIKYFQISSAPWQHATVVGISFKFENNLKIYIEATKLFVLTERV